MEVKIKTHEGSWIDAAVAELQAAADRARSEGRASLALCLAGGLTPEPVYRALSALPLGGLAVDLWLGDERVVGADSPARNGVMVARSYASCVWDPAPRIRLWPEAETEIQAVSAARAYEAELRSALGPRPAFDLALLGLGADGHTASLFPGSPALEVAVDDAGLPRLAVVTRSPVAPFARMTLTLGALEAARRRIFLVRGGDKLEALRKLEAEDPSIPASSLAGPGSLVLFLERSG